MLFHPEILRWIQTTGGGSSPHAEIARCLWRIRNDPSSQKAHSFTVSGDKLTCIMAGKEKPAPIKPGKMVTLLLGSDALTSTQIDSFVTSFKADFFMDASQYEVKVLSGEEIRDAYNTDNYYDTVPFEVGGTELGKSCMNNDLSYMDIYAHNPSVVSLATLIYTDSEGESGIVARALLWKAEALSDSDVRFDILDRVYSNQPAHKRFMERWGQSQGMHARVTSDDFTPPGMERSLNLRLRVRLDEARFEEYPYIDTFRWVDRDVKVAYNNDPNDSDVIECDETDGNFSGGEEDHEGQVWSSYHDEWIDEDDVTYCDELSDYLYDEYVKEVDGRTYHHESSKIIEAVWEIRKWSNDEDYFLVEDTFTDSEGDRYHVDLLSKHFAEKEDDGGYYLISSLEDTDNGEAFIVNGERKYWYNDEFVDELPGDEEDEQDDNDESVSPKEQGVDILGNSFTMGDEDYLLVTLDDGSLTGNPIWIHKDTLAIAPAGRFKLLATNQLQSC